MTSARIRLPSASRHSVALLVALVCAGCQSPSTATGGGSAYRVAASPGVSSSSDAAISDSDASSDAARNCEIAVEEHIPTSFQHVTDCSPIAYDTNPPSGGDHYFTWAAYQSYDFPVPPGFLVHELEHGAVVIWYDCPGGCPDEISQAKAWMDALPPDDACNGYPTARRVSLTPDPQLNARWAASSWGWTLRADCFDPAAFTKFYTDHFGQGREQTCAPGTVIRADTCP